MQVKVDVMRQQIEALESELHQQTTRRFQFQFQFQFVCSQPIRMEAEKGQDPKLADHEQEPRERSGELDAGGGSA